VTDTTTPDNLIRLNDADLDRQIYRIYSAERFKTLLANKQDAVVNPTKWGDPFEIWFLERTEVTNDASGATTPLNNLARDWYGQCWSFNADTDAMWRIYSSDVKRSAGVKVRTTIRKLFENLKAVGSPAPYLQFFVGVVTYLSEDAIKDMMRPLTFRDLTIGAPACRFANLLCIKRTAFEHEAEVRLLFQDIKLPDHPKRGVDGVFRYPLQPGRVFEEVVLDPRLTPPDAERLANELTTAGWTLPISQSPLYQAPRFVIPF
jgi:hypothetical protein